MALYDVYFTRKAQGDIDNILGNSAEYGFKHTLNYIRDIQKHCESLRHMPNRYERKIINGIKYRSFTYKAHQIFYRVDINRHQILIAAILHGAQNRDKQL